MKNLQLTFISLFALLMITSCQGNGKQSEKSTAVTEKSDREAFTAQNRRRRPGYPDELMSRLKSELQLDESQWQMLKAVNKAFEKSYHDAHDFYHGNGELAREYWQRYDKERKNALKQLFNETQYEQYLEIVKDVTPQGGH